MGSSGRRRRLCGRLRSTDGGSASPTRSTRSTSTPLVTTCTGRRDSRRAHPRDAGRCRGAARHRGGDDSHRQRGQQPVAPPEVRPGVVEGEHDVVHADGRVPRPRAGGPCSTAHERGRRRTHCREVPSGAPAAPRDVTRSRRSDGSAGRGRRWREQRAHRDDVPAGRRQAVLVPLAVGWPCLHDHVQHVEPAGRPHCSSHRRPHGPVVVRPETLRAQQAVNLG